MHIHAQPLSSAAESSDTSEQRTSPTDGERLMEATLQSSLAEYESCAGVTLPSDKLGEEESRRPADGGERRSGESEVVEESGPVVYRAEEEEEEEGYDDEELDELAYEGDPLLQSDDEEGELS